MEKISWSWNMVTVTWQTATLSLSLSNLVVSSEQTNSQFWKEKKNWWNCIDFSCRCHVPLQEGMGGITQINNARSKSVLLVFIVFCQSAPKILFFSFLTCVYTSPALFFNYLHIGLYRETKQNEVKFHSSRIRNWYKKNHQSEWQSGHEQSLVFRTRAVQSTWNVWTIPPTPPTLFY